MAKCGNTNINGGGSASSDDCTATKDKVLKGYTALTKDSNDEVNEGTIPTLSGNAFGGADETAFDTSPIVGAANNNAVGAFDYPLHGYFDNDAVRVHIPNLLPNNIKAGVKVGGKKASLTGTFTSDANAQSSHILSGRSAYVNGAKVNGTIPIQSGDASSDQAWAINRTAWSDGNLFFGVRNGYYLNGVNWIRAHDPAFVASNIKKGTTMWGITGSFEGYVPTATDLYLRGNNIAGFKLSGYNGNGCSVRFESGGIQLIKSYVTLQGINPINFNAYNYLNVEFYYETVYTKSPTANLTMGLELFNASSNTILAKVNSSELWNNVSRTISINLSNLSLTAIPSLKLRVEGDYYYDGNDGRYWTKLVGGDWTGWLYRVWLS